MNSFFVMFKEKFSFQDSSQEELLYTNNLIALGVLFWVVAQSDEKFLISEKEKIQEVLRTYSKISDSDMLVVLRAVEEAAQQRVDLYSFCQEAAQDLALEGKLEIVENLFRLACVDDELSDDEHEAIRKISLLLRLDHKDFIDSKIRIKKEFGMETY